MTLEKQSPLERLLGIEKRRWLDNVDGVMNYEDYQTRKNLKQQIESALEFKNEMEKSCGGKVEIRTQLDIQNAKIVDKIRKLDLDRIQNSVARMIPEVKQQFKEKYIKQYEGLEKLQQLLEVKK